MKKLILSVLSLLVFSIYSQRVVAQVDSAFCSAISVMLTEMETDFNNIKGDIHSGYQGDEYMATKKLPGAIEARIPDYSSVVCQNIFMENEESREAAFAKYDELVKLFTGCMPADWAGKDYTKIQDRDKRNYKFTKADGEVTQEIVIIAWKQFNGFTVTVRFSKR